MHRRSWQLADLRASDGHTQGLLIHCCDWQLQASSLHTLVHPSRGLATPDAFP